VKQKVEEEEEEEEERFGDKSERRGNTVQEPNRKDTKEREGGTSKVRRTLKK
jgi:hypothetical protein